MHADVGPRQLEGFPHHRQRGRGDDIMGVDAERILQIIHTNLMRLTHKVPMAQVEDLPEAMQRQVVGVPRAWVHIRGNLGSKMGLIRKHANNKFRELEFKNQYNFNKMIQP